MTTSFDSYWSNRIPNSKQIKDIIQISYSLHENAEKAANGLCVVYADNNFAKSAPYLWATLPLKYESHLKRIFFRLDLFSYACNPPKGDVDDTKLLKSYLGHLDHILDSLFEEAFQVDNLDSSWRSPSFEKWLAVEFHIQRHTTVDIDTYVEENGTDWMGDDVLELGEFHLQYLYNFLF
jgi:hypothetical protein